MIGDWQPFFGIIGFIIGVAGFWYARNSYKRQRESESVLNELRNEKQNRNKEVGFFPLKSDLGGDPLLGLDSFGEQILEGLKHCRKSIRMCMITPLLGSLKAGATGAWEEFNGESRYRFCGDDSKWYNTFCSRFLDLIMEQSKSNPGFFAEIVCMSPTRLLAKARTGWKSVSQRGSVEAEFLAAHEYFLKEIRSILEESGGKFCHHCVPPEFPFNQVIFDSEDIDSERGGRPFGVVGFVNYFEFEKNSDVKETEKFASRFPIFGIYNKDMARFFDSLQATISLVGMDQENLLYKILNRCQSTGMHDLGVFLDWPSNDLQSIAPDLAQSAKEIAGKSGGNRPSYLLFLRHRDHPNSRVFTQGEET